MPLSDSGKHVALNDPLLNAMARTALGLATDFARNYSGFDPEREDRLHDDLLELFLRYEATLREQNKSLLAEVIRLRGEQVTVMALPGPGL